MYINIHMYMYIYMYIYIQLYTYVDVLYTVYICTHTLLIYEDIVLIEALLESCRPLPPRPELMAEASSH